MWVFRADSRSDVFIFCSLCSDISVGSDSVSARHSSSHRIKSFESLSCQTSLGRSSKLLQNQFRSLVRSALTVPLSPLPQHFVLGAMTLQSTWEIWGSSLLTCNVKVVPLNCLTMLVYLPVTFWFGHWADCQQAVILEAAGLRGLPSQISKQCKVLVPSLKIGLPVDYPETDVWWAKSFKSNKIKCVSTWCLMEAPTWITSCSGNPTKRGMLVCLQLVCGTALLFIIAEHWKIPRSASCLASMEMERWNVRFQALCSYLLQYNQSGRWNRW